MDAVVSSSTSAGKDSSHTCRRGVEREGLGKIMWVHKGKGEGELHHLSARAEETVDWAGPAVSPVVEACFVQHALRELVGVADGVDEHDHLRHVIV